MATASGLEVAAVRDLPWRARLVASAEPDRAIAWRTAQEFAGEEEMALIELSRHQAVLRHVANVFAWYGRAASAATEDELDDLEPLTDAEEILIHGRTSPPAPPPS